MLARACRFKSCYPHHKQSEHPTGALFVYKYECRTWSRLPLLWSKARNITLAVRQEYHADEAVTDNDPLCACFAHALNRVNVIRSTSSLSSIGVSSCISMNFADFELLRRGAIAANRIIIFSISIISISFELLAFYCYITSHFVFLRRLWQISDYFHRPLYFFINLCYNNNMVVTVPWREK